MYNIFLFIHIAVVFLYLIFLTWKLFYLWFGNEENLLLFSEKSKAANIILLVLIIVTGLYLGFAYDFAEGLWFSVKLGSLIVSAFIGDYAFKNNNKLLGVFSL